MLYNHFTEELLGLQGVKITNVEQEENLRNELADINLEILRRTFIKNNLEDAQEEYDEANEKLEKINNQIANSKKKIKQARLLAKNAYEVVDKYLNDTYLDILYSNYNLDYLKSIDENNFIEIYNLLKSKGFYFIEDIIINYMDIFELDSYYLNKVLTYLESKMGKDYIKRIGLNMTILDKIIDTTINLEMKED